MGRNKRVIDLESDLYSDINGLTRLSAPMAFDIFLLNYFIYVIFPGQVLVN